MEKKMEEAGKIIVIMIMVFGVWEAVAPRNPNPQIYCPPNAASDLLGSSFIDSRCRNPYTAASDFNCSDPNGLPCSEDVLDGFNLPEDGRPDFTRLNCTNSTDSVSFSCVCNTTHTSLGNILVCHIVDISTAVYQDLSGGILHENVSMLTHLEELYLYGNRLGGNIPDSLGYLKSLKRLQLMHNFLNGSIPTSFENLESLETLALSDNMLSGEIPKGLGKLSRLMSLHLHGNQVTGHLPSELGNLANLVTFDVGSNYLDGVLDVSYEKLSSVVKFAVDRNNLSGLIPEFISKWKSLTYLDLTGNNFEGNIPLQIFKMTNLTTLIVSDLKNTGVSVFPEQVNLTNIEFLVLRNCNLTGHIPEFIGNSQMYHLELSFNNLTGPIPDGLQNVSTLVLAGNMLEGKIPAWIYEKDSKTDISLNNFQIPDSNNSGNTTYNMTGPSISPTRNYIADQRKRCDSLNYKLFINCGGGKQTYEGDEYEEDTSLRKFYESETKSWAYSCSGYSYFADIDSEKYIKNKTCGVSDQGLQETARLCPISLTYYAFCLHNGNYSVKLQFAELLNTDDEGYASNQRRVFDVYIQGEKKLKDFDIKNETGEANKATSREFVANVRDNQLEIHFYWAGKGSYSLNGPLVSAIAVTPNFTIGHKKLSAGQITGITAGSVLAPILLLAFLWKMGWLRNNELQKIWVEVEEKRYTLQQIVDATRHFSPTTKIGEGRFGTVYKAEFPNDKIKLAVKRISPDLMQDTIKTELQGEIYNLKSLKHDNLIKLYDGYSKKDLHLLIYEYMEKGSLHQAVLDANPKELLDWKVRFNICLGLANALKYLHEETGLMILHRNIKASNILLDGNYNAKLTDFGWARLYNREDPFMTFKAGTARVYMAPEYAWGQPITAKADVYSYGVLMLEVFSGRPSIQNKPNQESAYLLDDARTAHARRRMDKLVDPKMENYDRKVVYNALNLAMMCINPAANLRPTMSEVASVLLQERSLEDITKAHISEAGDTSKSDH